MGSALFKGDESARELGAAFGAPAAQHLAAAFGGHTLTESVISDSTQSAGLKWSFHGCTSWLNR